MATKKRPAARAKKNKAEDVIRPVLPPRLPTTCGQETRASYRAVLAAISDAETNEAVLAATVDLADGIADLAIDLDDHFLDTFWSALYEWRTRLGPKLGRAPVCGGCGEWDSDRLVVEGVLSKHATLTSFRRSDSGRVEAVAVDNGCRHAAAHVRCHCCGWLTAIDDLTVMSPDGEIITGPAEPATDNDLN